MVQEMLRGRRIRLVCVFALLAAACSTSRKEEIPEPPEVLSVVWKREGLERPPLDRAPQAVREWRPQEWLRASYRSYASVVLVDAYRMPSEAVAFEARQKWRSEPGSVAIHRGKLLIVCSSPVEPTRGLAEFSAKLEAEWLATER
jgi:hypothetical protein